MPLVGLRQHLNRPGSRTNRPARWLAAAALLSLATILSACAGQPALPAQPGSEELPGLYPVQPVTVQGQYMFDFYPAIFAIAVFVFLLVEGLLLWITFRHRRKSADGGLPRQTHGNNILEIVWTAIPAVVVTALFIVTVNTLGRIDETAATTTPAVTIDVTGFQWQWTFEYRDHDISLTGSGSTGPVMAIPVNESVRIRLHATDVIHSFYVPQFLYKKDAIPGRVNQFDVIVDQVGTFSGQCAEFCGLAHSDMHFTVQAMTRADFDAWLLDQQRPEPSGPPPADAQTVSVSSISVVDGYDPKELTIRANTPWVVQLTNVDPAVPHDFAVRGANPDGSDWQGDPDAPGGGSATYQPPILAPGEYEFYCSIHPNMIGTLRVGE